jgi:PAS domain S-box-containing protein
MNSSPEPVDDRTLIDDLGQYQALFEHLPEGLLIVNPETGAVTLNRAARGLLGFNEPTNPRLEALAELLDVRTLDGAVLDLADWPLSQVSRGLPIGVQRLRVRHRTAGWSRVLQCRSAQVPYPAHRPIACLLVSDVTGQIATEESLARLNRLYDALSHVNQALIHVPSRQELLLQVCRALVIHGGFGMVWIGRNDPATHRLVPEASWGKDAHYPQTIEIFTDDRPEGRGPSGTAFRNGLPYVCNDLQQDPATVPWRDAYRHHGFLASASFPIRERGVVSGILAVYAYEKHAFAEKETALLVESAADISFALDNLIRDEEMQRATEAVREEQLFSASLLESLPGIFYFYDQQGRFLRWNREFSTVTGYGTEEIAAMRPLEFFVERDRIRAQQRIDAVFRTGFAELEADLLSKDGHATPYYFTGRRTVVAGITGLIGVGIDLTALHRAEAAVRESMALSRGVLDSMMAHIAVLDAEGRILMVNDAWRKFSLENSTSRGDTIASTHVGADYLAACRRTTDASAGEPTAVYDGLRAVLNGERSFFQLEYPCHTPTRDRWFLMTATRLRTAKGGAVVAHMEITDRKEAELQLRLGNQRFEMLTSATNDAVFDWDLRTDSVWWNEGVERLFGFQREELRSDINFWMGRIHPEDRDRVESGIYASIRSGDTGWTARFRFQRGDGSYAEVHDRGQIIRDMDGRAIRMLSGITDITEQLRMEEQLRQALRLEALGQLTGGVAHDFNNLLTVILGNAELLVEQLEAGGSQRELAQMIVGASGSAAELTNRLLAFGRKQALNPVAVDCDRLVADLLPLLRRTLGAPVEIHVSTAPLAWQALVDPAQLENAILNLCINSRDAMPDGGRLLIQVENLSLDDEYTARQLDVIPGDYVVVSVTDTGSGVPKEISDRIFEPFFTTKEKGRGTGLGLAMVYGFIKQSGGHVLIYSEPGEGTAVKMYLPRSVDPSETDVLPAEAPMDVRGTEAILLVEDDDSVRRLSNRHLQSLGYRILQARNGVEARQLLEQHPDIDLLFTDVVMPGGINGRELAEFAIRLRPKLKVLFTSGYSADAVVSQGRLNRGVNLLSKPYRRRDLAVRVRSILDSPS